MSQPLARRDCADGRHRPSGAPDRTPSQAMKRGRRRASRALGTLVLIVCASCGSDPAPPASMAARPPSAHVVLIGIDAGDWLTIESARAEGGPSLLCTAESVWPHRRHAVDPAARLPDHLDDHRDRHAARQAWRPRFRRRYGVGRAGARAIGRSARTRVVVALLGAGSHRRRDRVVGDLACRARARHHRQRSAGPPAPAARGPRR